MARIDPGTIESASPEVSAVFTEIQGVFGMVPNLFRAYAGCPPLLEANWNKVKALMMGGSLRRRTKEVIAVLVSKDNSCDYCVAAHTAALRSIGMTEHELAALDGDLGEAGLKPVEQALVAFARQANADPHGVSDGDFQRLRDAGARDTQIIEALGVMELFLGFNNFLNTVQCEIDF